MLQCKNISKFGEQKPSCQFCLFRIICIYTCCYSPIFYLLLIWFRLAYSPMFYPSKFTPYDKQMSATKVSSTCVVKTYWALKVLIQEKQLEYQREMEKKYRTVICPHQQQAEKAQPWLSRWTLSLIKCLLPYFILTGRQLTWGRLPRHKHLEYLQLSVLHQL